MSSSSTDKGISEGTEKCSERLGFLLDFFVVFWVSVGPYKNERNSEMLRESFDIHESLPGFGNFVSVHGMIVGYVATSIPISGFKVSSSLIPACNALLDDTENRN